MCVELLTVLWVVPTLGMDRLLLALLLTLYLGLAHGLDQQDLRYLRAQLQRKLHLLSRPQDGRQSEELTLVTSAVLPLP